MYRKSHDQENKDLMNMFDGYPILLWESIIAALILLAIILAIGRWLLEKKKDLMESIWIVSMFTLDQDYLVESNLFLSVLSTFISFFCYFLTQYLLNSMGTDLVVIKDPIVLQSYQDVIDRNATPLFLKGWPDYKDFENSPETTIERKLWLHAKKMEVITGKEPFVPLGPQTLSFKDQLLEQKVTLIFDKVTSLIIMRQYAEGIKESKDNLILLSRREEQNGVPVVFMGMPAIEKDFYDQTCYRVQKMIEVGVIQKIIDKVCDRTVEPTPALLDKYGWTIQRDEKSDPDVSVKIRFKNVHHFFRIIMMAYAVAVIVLLLEISYKKSLMESERQKKAFVTVRRSPTQEARIAQLTRQRAMAHRKDAIPKINRNFRI